MAPRIHDSVSATPSYGTADLDCIWIEGFGGSVWETTQDGAEVDSISVTSSPRGLGFTPDTCLWIATGVGSIYKYTQSGSLVSGYNPGGTRGLDGDSSGSIWRVDDQTNDILKFNSNFSTIDSIPTPSDGAHGLGIDADDCIWTVDTTQNSIYKQDSSGCLLVSFGVEQGATYGVGADSNNCIWEAGYGGSTSIVYQKTQTGSVVDEWIAPSGDTIGIAGEKF